MEEETVRIKLKFQDIDVLTSQQIEDGLAQSWYLVQFRGVRTIADVASDVRFAFNLEDSCPNGLSFQVDGFVLPASQPAILLKNSDVVRVKRIRDNPGMSITQISHRTWNGPRREYLHEMTGYHGVELRALDEFERETGGYESGEEKETDPSLDGGKPLEESKATPSKTQTVGAGKKSKKAKTSVSAVAEIHARDERRKKARKDKEKDQAGVTWYGTLQNFEAAGAASNLQEEQPDKKSKKRKSRVNEEHVQGDIREENKHSGLDEMRSVLDVAKDGQSKLKRKKMKHSGSPSATKGDGAETAPNEGQAKRAKETVAAENGLREGETLKNRKTSSKTDVSKKSRHNEVTDGHLKGEKIVGKLVSPSNNSRTTAHIVNGGEAPTSALKDKTDLIQAAVEHRPSRSARRKKAKRQWLREQAKEAQLTAVDSHVLTKGIALKARGEKEANRILTAESTGDEEEEEVLPVVVRAGHIRFEPLEKGEDSDQRERSTPMLELGDKFKTKRQGQNWGQEKRSEAGKSKAWESQTRVPSPDILCEAKCNGNDVEMNSTTVEQLPLLDIPKEGDQVVYRLLELSTSWTPEVSPYRVGVVVRWDSETNVIKLDPLKSRVAIEAAEDFQDETYLQENEAISPYDAIGSLEIDFSSLMDVRLLRREPGHDREGVEGSSKEIEDGLKLEDSNHHADDTATPAANVTVAASAPLLVGGDGGEGDEVPRAAPWQDLVAAELEKKKMELCQSGTDPIDPLQRILAPSEQTLNQSKSLESPALESNGIVAPHGATAGRGRKNKHLRSAGVGTIVALLRSQQAI